MTAIKTKWKMEADFFQGCNCNYGCPCEFEAPPTMGFCEGLGIWRINKGKYGSISLDGLGLGFAAHWPKAIHEGQGTAAIFVDEKATPQQREALLNIASGQAGGLPFELIAATFSKVLDPFFVPFQFNSHGRNTTVSMGDKVDLSLEPIKNPVTGEDESISVEHGTGFIFKKAECFSAKVCDSKVDGLRYSWPGKNGFISKISYGN